MDTNSLLQCKVYIDDNTNQPIGWVYFSLDANSDDVWQLWWIGVLPGRQGEGIGVKLLTTVEHTVQGSGGRLLLIETTSQPLASHTRQFYAKRDYKQCGCIPDFYGVGDDKMIYVKHLQTQNLKGKADLAA